MKKTIWLFLVAALSLGLALTACDSGGGGEEGDNCTTVCDGKECGTIGDCVCGACGEGEACQANMCETISAECTAACEGKICGDFEDCNCGACAEGETCNADGTACETVSDECVAACDGLDCGTVDGCDCGKCEDGFTCGDDNMCVEDVVCDPVCDDGEGNVYECGDDTCEGTCGECDSGDQWDCVDHMCVCTPDCGDAVCGDDGCGGSCGDCADDETCSGGQCFTGCDHSAKVWDQPILKVNHLAIDGDGLAGHGLDVDMDAGTCAPVDNCENGIDNALGGILGQVETYINVAEELENAMVDGTIVLLVEMDGYMGDGTEFPTYFYIGEITGDQAACDYMTAKCDYLVDPMSYSIETCMPLISFDNATVDAGAFTAGGPDAIFSMSLDIEGIALTITAVKARIEADVTEDAGMPTAMDNGIIGGAVPKALIMEAVDNLPDDLDLPVSAELIKGMLDMFIVPDIDAGDDYGMGDPDGTPESASVGIQFGAIEGAVTGFKAEDAE